MRTRGPRAAQLADMFLAARSAGDEDAARITKQRLVALCRQAGANASDLIDDARRRASIAEGRRGPT